MARKKQYRASTEAQKLVRELVQSMTPENRRSFHEGLRVAFRERLEDALARAHEAGASGSGCEFWCE